MIAAGARLLRVKSPVGAIGEAGRDFFNLVQTRSNRAAHGPDQPLDRSAVSPPPCAPSRYTVHPEHNRDRLCRSLLQVIGVFAGLKHLCYYYYQMFSEVKH